MVDGQFSTYLNCSAHRLRISFRSVIRVVPSALMSGVTHMTESHTLLCGRHRNVSCPSDQMVVESH